MNTCSLCSRVTNTTFQFNIVVDRNLNTKYLCNVKKIYGKTQRILLVRRFEV